VAALLSDVCPNLRVHFNKSHTRDHDRQKVLHKLGIKYIDYAEGRECHEYPDEVVRKFLVWLEQMYTAP